MLVAKAIKEIVATWRENTQRMTESLFDGSDGSNLKLTLLMDNAAMLTEDALDGIDPNSMTATLKKALHAQMIPITWSVSAENMYPVIIRVSARCSSIVCLPLRSPVSRRRNSAAQDRHLLTGQTTASTG